MSTNAASVASPGRLGRLGADGLLLLIDLYRVTLAPLIGGFCRYEPSCSRYAEEAIRRHGALRGSAPRPAPADALSSPAGRGLRPGAVSEHDQKGKMEERRLLVALALSILVMTAWSHFFGPKGPTPSPRRRPRVPDRRRPLRPLPEATPTAAPPLPGEEAARGCPSHRGRRIGGPRGSGHARGHPGLHQPGGEPLVLAALSLPRRPGPRRGNGAARAQRGAAPRPRNRRPRRRRAIARGALPAVRGDRHRRRRGRRRARLRLGGGRPRGGEAPPLPSRRRARRGFRLGQARRPRLFPSSCSSARASARRARRRRASRATSPPRESSWAPPGSSACLRPRSRKGDPSPA